MVTAGSGHGWGTDKQLIMPEDKSCRKSGQIVCLFVNCCMHCLGSCLCMHHLRMNFIVLKF